MTELDRLAALHTDLWVFDNDGTLFDVSHLERVIEHLMDEFFAKLFNTNFVEGRSIRIEYKKRYSTRSTVVALHRGGIAVESFIRETYLAVGHEAISTCSPTALASLVSKLPGRKIVLTNNPSEFTLQVLRKFGLDHMFDSIYGIRELNFIMKPEHEAFAPLKAVLAEKKRVIFIDDVAENVIAAARLGCIARRWNGKRLVKIGGNNALS